jgi:prepilin-type N-terminal cleavage/methylation domain-containing protein
MTRPARSPRSRGFTIIEMLTVVAILGLILSLVSLEFINVVSDTLHTRADTDAEAQARLAMSKISTQMRTGYWDYIDFPNPSPTPYPVVSPLPNTTTLPYVAFYRAVPGDLSAGMPVLGNGAPNTTFELVTFQMNALQPGELDEVTTVQPNGVASTPMPIAQDVSDFEVTADPTIFGKYDVRITVSIPSSHCTSNNCTFTLDSVVYAGGTQ